MASSKEYLGFILDQLSDLKEITYKSMMGEYIIYYRDKVIGGIFDNRFLIKPVSSAVRIMPDAVYDLPYDGANKMLLVDNVDDRTLTSLIKEIYDELPIPKSKQKKK